MNKRIRELAEQAGFKTDEANLSFGNYIQDKEYFYADNFIEDELKKFAELIVRECIHITLKDSLPDWDNASSEANAQCIKIAVDLRQHFGVEE